MSLELWQRHGSIFIEVELTTSNTVGSLWRDPPVEIRRPFVRPQLQYHLQALCAGRDLKQPFVSHRSLLSGGDKQKIQGVNKIEI